MMNGCMASACATSRPLVPVGSGAWTLSPACPSKKSPASRCRGRPKVTCRATGGRGDDDDGLLSRPRRDVLTAGLSGLAAAGMTGYPGLASAALEAELLEKCRRGDKVSDKLVECTDPYGKIPCPPLSQGSAVDFKPDPLGGAVRRVRQPAHLLSPEEQAKYREAVARMRALPASHPLSFAAQAAIHEAYCDGHYRYDPAEKNRPFDVHFSWVFAPWHRMYLYFYERALGELVGDDAFALPFWNWDAPAGMVIPPLFAAGGAGADANPLYDPFRDASHLDKLIDLDVKSLTSGGGPELIPFDGPRDARYMRAVDRNLCVVYNQQIRAGRGARAFLGERLCSRTSLAAKEINERSKRRRQQGGKQEAVAVAVDKNKGQGSLERMAHSAVHVWAGRGGSDDPRTCVLGHDGAVSCYNDMGFLGTAGRDPLFYSHHANVDRMWHLWATRLAGGDGFDDPEWLDASFVFYDGVANPRKVRMTFRDVLDTRRLGYTYAAEAETDAALPWLQCKLTPLVPHGKDRRPATARPSPLFPVTLRKGEVVEVPAVAVPAARPGQQRVLVIQGIEYDPRAQNAFDVAINVPREAAPEVGPQNTEYAGSFAPVPSSKEGAAGNLEGKLCLYIDAVLADVEADGGSAVDVVLVPRTDKDIKLYFAPTILNQD